MSDSSEESIYRVLSGVLGIPFTTGNRVEVLRNGRQIFPAMLAAIDEAKSRIEFLTFVYWSGDIAERFATALADRASAGVDVKVLLDAVGAMDISESLLDRMRAAGVSIEWFRPKSRWKIWEIDNRTHRKVLVVDGRIGFTGGVGIASQWEGDARNENEWRDTHFRITGPAVLGLQGAFYGNWAETGNRITEPPDTLPMPENRGSARLQVVRATASTGWSDIASLLQLLICRAERRLRIATAYFVPDEDVVAGLCDAVSAGAEVDIMLPGEHSDQRVSQIAGEAAFRDLLGGGVRLWKYQRSMLHAKIMTIDGVAACIGSANFNQRSMRKDDEVALVMLDAGTVSILDRHFDDDLKLCERIDPAAWRRRGPVQRLLEAAVSPFRSHT